MLFPTRIDLDTKAIADLKQLYTDALSNIAETLTNASGFTLAHNRVLLGQVIQELNRLGVDTTDWLQTHIPAQYQKGVDDALAQMNHFGMLVTTPTMQVVNHESLQAIMQDASNKFGQAMTTITRSVEQVMNDAVRQSIRQRIAEGALTGANRVTNTQAVSDAIREGGIFALRDAGGKRWAIDTYAEMLVTTKMAEARNTALSDMMMQNGYDLAEVSAHGAQDACGKWEGNVLSLSGNTEGYDSVATAIAGGLFHPNCKHSLNVVNPDLSGQTVQYNRESKQYVPSSISLNGGLGSDFIGDEI